MTLDERGDARAEQILNDLIACIDGVSGGDECYNWRHDGKLGYHVRDNSTNTARGGSGILDSESQETDVE